MLHASVTSASAAATRPVPLSPDDLFRRLSELVEAAERVTTRFRRRIPGMDENPRAPFALQEISLAGRRGLSQVELARTLAMSPSSATRLIDGLEGAGMVRRAPHPNDRRVKQIVLTAQGREVLDELMRDLAQGGEAAGLDAPALDRFSLRLSHLSNIIA